MERMEIKVKRLFRIEGESSLKAFADIAVNEALLIKGIRIVESKQGLFVSMPREKAKDNRWYESVRCLSPQIKDQIADEVLAAYHSESKA